MSRCECAPNTNQPQQSTQPPPRLLLRYSITIFLHPTKASYNRTEATFSVWTIFFWGGCLICISWKEPLVVKSVRIQMKIQKEYNYICGPSLNTINININDQKQHQFKFLHKSSKFLIQNTKESDACI